MEPRPSRQAKDYVFADMFNQPKYRLELFKALHPEATDITEVESRAWVQTEPRLPQGDREGAGVPERRL